MINSTDGISNPSDYEPNQINYNDQNTIRSHPYNDSANFRLDEYHKHPDSYNNYQIPPPKYQDIDQFVSSSLNKKDQQYNENLNFRPNEPISDSNQDVSIPQIDESGKPIDISLYEKNKKGEANDPNDQQDFDYGHQIRYGEPTSDIIYPRRQIQQEPQIDYRHQHSPVQYEPRPSRSYYNDSFGDYIPKNSPQQQYYSQQYQDLRMQPPLRPLMSQYRGYQDDYPPIDMKQDRYNPGYQSQYRQYDQTPPYFHPPSPIPAYPKYSQYQHPPTPPPPPQSQIYSQQAYAPPLLQQQQQPMQSQQIYNPPQLQQQQPQQQQYQDQDQEIPPNSKFIYSHQPNIMLVDIPPTGRFAKPKSNKLQQKFNCKIISTEIANFSPDSSFQDDQINVVSSRSNSGSTIEYSRPPILPNLPQQEQPVVTQKPTLTYQNNSSYQQTTPQQQIAYPDRNYQHQDTYNYRQSYSQEPRRSPSPQYYQQQTYQNQYQAQELPQKSTNNAYYQFPTPQINIQEQQPVVSQALPMPSIPQIPQPQISPSISSDQQYYSQPNHYQYQAGQQTLNENESSQSQAYPPDSNSYSDYDDQHKNYNQEPQYVASTDEGGDGGSSNDEDNESDSTAQNAPKKRGRPKLNNPKQKNKVVNPINEALQSSLKNGNVSVDNENENKNEQQQQRPEKKEEIELKLPESINNKKTESEESKDGLEIFQKKRTNFRPQRYIMKIKVPQDNADGNNADQDTVVEEREGTFIKKGRGVFLRPNGFDEALSDETLSFNPYALGFQPQSFWETVNRDITFGRIVNTYFQASNDKERMTKFIFKLYNMLLMTSHDDRYKELVGFNWYSDFVISINRFAASAMLNLSTSNYDTVLPELLDECGFIEVTPGNYALAHLDSFSVEDTKDLNLYCHRSSQFSKREMNEAELESLEVKKIKKRGRKRTKYPANT